MTDFPALNLRDVQASQAGKIDKKTMNELRAMLYTRGVEYDDDATKAELIEMLTEKK